MARLLRIEYENAFYHITARGNSKGIIFRDENDREIFLNVVKEAYLRFGFIVHAFVLMDNHYHLLLETPQANLSASMHHINTVYTQAFHRRHKTVGHLLQGRFKAIIVDRDAYYLELVRYIHLNPWRAGMVKQLDSFRYSSHRAIVDKKWAVRWKNWYDRNIILQHFGKTEEKANSSYRDFINAGKGKESPLKNIIGGYVLGDRKFADWLWSEFIEGRDVKEIVRVKNLRPKSDVSSVVSAIAKCFGVNRNEVFDKKRGQIGLNEIRGMSLYILYKHSGLTQRAIGELTGGISRNVVSEVVRKIEKEMQNDDKLRRRYQEILATMK